MSPAESSSASAPSSDRAASTSRPESPVRHRRKLWHWQDWSLTSKLLALLLIPLLVIAALGAVQVRTETARSASYRTMDRLIRVTDELGTALSAVQQERTAAVTYIAGGADGDPNTLTTHQAQLQQSSDRLTEDMAALKDLPAGRLTRYAAAHAALDRLPGIRQQVAAHTINAAKAIGSYTAVTSALLALEQALSSSIGDNDLAPTIQGLHLVRAAQEYIFYQQVIILGGISRGSLSTPDAAEVQLTDARLGLALDTFRSTATPAQVAEYQTQVEGAPVDLRNSLKERALTELTAPPGTTTTSPPLTVEQWNQVSLQTSDRMSSVVRDLSGSLHDTAARLKQRADQRTVVIGGIAALAILLALAGALLFSRSLRRSLRAVRRSARDIADHQLPDAMIKLRVGDEIETTPVSVPVRSFDEVGQLARAVEDMHGRALHLAIDQVNIRGSYNEIFVNLSRRSESLVRRQLSLIEQMERGEEDPDTLGTLFQLDHLATRMRRNNENLMVLSGSDVARRFNRPIPLSDVVRAAVSEIEQYQRATLQAPVQKAVVGYAAGDLVRLIAELLDNATTFSAPETLVTVTTDETRDGGISIDIRDRGVGMSAEAVEAANATLNKPGEVDVSTSRQMGLFVVARIAKKHGVRVRMHTDEEIRGLRVTVTLPPALSADLPKQALPPATNHPQLIKPIQHARPTRLVKAAEPKPPVAEQPPAAPEPAEAAPSVAAAEPEPAPTDDEKTPIFDTMLSVWFTDTKGSTNGTVQNPQAWQSEADRGFDAAGRAASTTPQEYTSAGLPKRRPGARVVPGSAAAKKPSRHGMPATNGVAPNAPMLGRATGPARHTAAPEQNADGVRGRLANYQRGLQRGRDIVEGETPAIDGEAPAVNGEAPAVNGEAPAVNGEAPAVNGTQAPAGATVNGTPQHPANGTAPEPANGVATPVSNGVPETNGTPQPAARTLTTAGLPRRTPGASRVPAAAATPVAPARHSAEQVRGQLTSYKAGVSKGREAVGEPTSENFRPAAQVAVPQSGPQEKE